MAFPSGKNQKTLDTAFDRSRNASQRIKQRAIDIRDSSLAGTLSRKDIVEFPTDIADALDEWNAAKALPGIGQYAKDQLDDQTITLGTEFTAMVAACEAVRDWITVNTPKSGNWLLERSFDVNGRLVAGTLTSAQTAGLRTELDALIATIDD